MTKKEKLFMELEEMEIILKKLSKMEKQNLISAAISVVDNKRKELMKDLNELKDAERRLITFARFLEDELPKKIRNRVTISFYTLGADWVYATATSNYAMTEHDTLLITDFCAGRNEKWRFEKKLDMNGKFFHQLTRRIPAYGASYQIEFKNIANIDGCKVVKEEYTATKYKIEC